jgi:uncharacterized protein (UPF0303 family)
MGMSIDDDLAVIAEQERLLVFPRFTGDDAWRVGAALRELVGEGEALAVEIQVAGHVLLRHAMPGVDPITGDWIRRKGNVALRFHHCSYAIGLKLQAEDAAIDSRYGLSPADFAPHGGAVPLRVTGTGVVGVAVASGLPQCRDHTLMVQALARAMDIAIPDLSA